MLTLRQKSIAELIPLGCDILADVGCDHGYIGAEALIRGNAKRVIFIDISAPSLNKARLLCNEQGLEDKVSFVCQDGLKDIVCDCAVIGGMGGLEIMSILSKAILPDRLILQPMRNVEDLRIFLCDNYHFVVDKTVFDKKYYNLLYLERGNDVLTQQEVEFGRTNLLERSDDFLDYLKKEITKCQSILAKKPNKAILQRQTALKTVLNLGE